MLYNGRELTWTNNDKLYFININKDYIYCNNVMLIVI